MGESVVGDKPKVSVVIPVYNTERYVRETVESILNQTLEEIEVILIDDGSTDNGRRVLEELKNEDRRVKLFVQENQGLSVTRNNGLKVATGEYVYFMDSDDILEPQTLAACYAECAEKSLDFVFFEADVFEDGANPVAVSFSFDYTRKVMDTRLVYTGKDAFRKQMEAHEFRSSVCLNFISSEFLKNHGLCFFSNILHEDQLFTAMLYLKASRTAYINQAFFHRRVRANSIMTALFSWRNMNGYFTVAEQLLKYAKGKKEEEVLVDFFLKQMLDAAVWKAYVMPFIDRVRLFIRCVSCWSSYISFKTLAVLLLKKTSQKWRH